jgi:hypothetical protein
VRARGAPAAVWLLFALDALAVLVTYSRTPADQLYHVSGSGLEGGASRALVFLNFSTALAAIAVLLVAGGGFLALVAGLLAAVVAWPGVVDQANLDARWINVVPAVGVALAAALTLRGDGLQTVSSPRGDRIRIVVAAVYCFFAIPWLAAELGFHFGAGIFLSGEPRAQPGLPGFPPAVHLGHHHGLDGLLLVATALLLSRVAPRRRIATVFLAALASYGLVNSAQDFWLEQVVKRGWTTWEIPGALQPSLSWIWLVIVWGAVALLPLLTRG